ncbi:uncharacterized protein LOC100897314 [Galendromus occidentalis]|uniref:Uncharacterized protein LOC100897314 n=1 Tax=Galendromus occidentalis TaxID=34638 RepID=A0AAJ6VZ25_9ACAR|nr:uncharacterized protein LOC100897314 [Galendromus occidentalis]
MQLFASTVAVVVCCSALSAPAFANDDIHGEILDYVTKIGEKTGLSKEHQSIVVHILHEKFPHDTKAYSKMTDVEKAEVDKKWAEAKKEIEAKMGADNKEDWEKFVKEFEKGTEGMHHGKTEKDRRRRSLFRI